MPVFNTRSRCFPISCKTRNIVNGSLNHDTDYKIFLEKFDPFTEGIIKIYIEARYIVPVERILVYDSLYYRQDTKTSAHKYLKETIQGVIIPVTILFDVSCFTKIGASKDSYGLRVQVGDKVWTSPRLTVRAYSIDNIIYFRQYETQMKRESERPTESYSQYKKPRTC